MSLLEVKDLCVDFLTSYGDVRAVHNVSFRIFEGETFGIIGESGSGKSVISLAILKLLPHNACISGTIYFNKKNLSAIKSEQMRSIRGKHISLMPQNPAVSLNTVLKNGIQLTEIFEQQKIDKKEGLRRSIDIMNKLFFKNPLRIFRFYPHQFSGGIKQRLLAAMALSFHPKLLIADEPTKGMDYEAKKKSIELFMNIKQEHGQTTIGRCIMGMEKPTKGEIIINGKNMLSMNKKEISKIRPQVQMIVQHPETSLNPRMKALNSIIEPLQVTTKLAKQDLIETAQGLMNHVGLRMEQMERYPHQMSGGEIQRISMLDVSVQAQILWLMEKIQSEKGISYLLISHDIEILKAVCDRIAYLDNGTITNIENI